MLLFAESDPALIGGLIASLITNLVTGYIAVRKQKVAEKKEDHSDETADVQAAVKEWKAYARALSTRHTNELAAKEKKVAELEAENTRLREKDGVFREEAAGLKVEVRHLKEEISELRSLMQENGFGSGVHRRIMEEDSVDESDQIPPPRETD